MDDFYDTIDCACTISYIIGYIVLMCSWKFVLSIEIDRSFILIGNTHGDTGD